jgi:hypothetical protein
MNRIGSILNEKGWDKLGNPRPSDMALEKMGVNIKTWNKWVLNKKDPELYQLPAIAEFLECNPADLIETQIPAGYVNE